MILTYVFKTYVYKDSLSYYKNSDHDFVQKIIQLNYIHFNCFLLKLNPYDRNLNVIILL